jgi:chorismate mutase
MTEPQKLETLADLRVDIDRIDAAMHALLMERGEIINRLIAVKARQGGGSAFRPGREASMMRALVERHRGLLPVDTVESIWRIIISTFTYVQANYSVHADDCAGDAAMRDSVRFHFGFTVPYLTHHGARGVIEAVERSSGDLGMVRVDAGSSGGAWWTALTEPQAPKIIARLPFVERPDHPAGLPVFLVAQPLAEAAAREIVLYSVALERWSGGLPAALGALGGEIIGNAPDGVGLSLLVSVPGATTQSALSEAFEKAGARALRMAEAGSHAPRYSFAGQRHSGSKA